MSGSPPFKQVFYADPAGRQPVLEWIKHDLSISTRRIVGTALREILQEQGVGVCGTPFGRQLGAGLFEFRLREEKLILRVFCHAYGDHLVLVLAACDKSEDPSGNRQNAEIEVARRRLTEWQESQRRG